MHINAMPQFLTCMMKWTVKLTALLDPLALNLIDVFCSVFLSIKKRTVAACCSQVHSKANRKLRWRAVLRLTKLQNSIRVDSMSGLDSEGRRSKPSRICRTCPASRFAPLANSRRYDLHTLWISKDINHLERRTKQNTRTSQSENEWSHIISKTRTR